MEESITLTVERLKVLIRHELPDTLYWWSGIRSFQVRASFRRHEGGCLGTMTLDYDLPGRRNIRADWPLVSTPTNFNGRRWWFLCAAVVKGVECRRRVGQLHLPPRATYFACRHCHRLSYRSSQEAHRDEREVAAIARLVGGPPPMLHPDEIDRQFIDDGDHLPLPPTRDRVSDRSSPASINGDKRRPRR